MTTTRTAILLIFLTSALLGACARKPTPQELSQLESTLSAADAAERKVRQLEAEKQQLEEELDREKQTLEDYRNELQQIRDELNQ